MHYSKEKIGYILRLEIGEEIQEALRQFADAVELKGAFYQGIGLINQVELAFFNRETKSHERHFLEEDHELVSLLGNISYSQEQTVAHSHVVLGNHRFETISGHLVRGMVSANVEIFLTPVDILLSREEDPILRYMRLLSRNSIHLPIQS